MNPQVIIEMENGKKMTLELMPEVAPLSVQNFLDLVEKKYYDGLIFHRVIQGFMIQGGCPQGVGTGGPGHNIKGEFSLNGVNNPIKHERGVISMARSQHPDSAGSQFFICHADAFSLDGSYAAFGKLLDGFDVLDEIATTATGFNDKPHAEQKIKAITVVS